MNDSGFLEDGFKDLHKQREQIKQEAAAKRAAGLKQVKALDPMDGNKLKTIWVQKDDATIAWEETEAKKTELKKRTQAVEQKKSMLDMLKFENEIAAKEKELAKVEKELVSASKKAIEEKAK